MEIARNKAPETQITDPNYLSCICVDEKGRTKTVISTAERAAFVTLSDSAGRIYGEVSNICEPFDFTAHVFCHRPFCQPDGQVGVFCRRRGLRQRDLNP